MDVETKQPQEKIVKWRIPISENNSAECHSLYNLNNAIQTLSIIGIIKHLAWAVEMKGFYFLTNIISKTIN